MQDFYYRKLLVYQHAMMLLEDVYHLTKKFPSSELHGLTNQIQRAAVSIPSNIAEGMGRFSIKDRIRFIDISNKNCYISKDDSWTKKEFGREIK